MKSIEEARALSRQLIQDSKERERAQAEAEHEIAAAIYRGEVTSFIRRTENFMDLPDEPVVHVVDRLILGGQLGFLIGVTRGGKTTITTQIAAAVANGLPVFGSRATTKRPVIVLDNENSLGTTQQRWKRLCAGISAKDVFWWGNWMYRDKPPTLSDDFIVAMADSMKDESGAAPLVICDSFVTFLNGGDENSAGDCAAILRNAAKLTNLGCAVVFIHHFGKSKPKNEKEWHSPTAGRGTSAQGGAIDYVYNFDSEIKENKVTWGKLYSGKSRDSEFQSWEVELEVVEGPGVFIEKKIGVKRSAGEVVQEAKNAASIKLLKALEEIVTKEGNKGILKGKFEEIAASIKGISQQTARDWWNGRETRGDIVVTRAGKYKSAPQIGVWKSFVENDALNGPQRTF